MKKLKTYQVGLLSQIVGGIFNTVLFGIKFYIGTITNCVSILQDGFNNLGDVLGNVAGGIGIGLSVKKPTEKYPHGFGRFEDIAALLMYIIYFAVGVFFIWSSIERLFFPFPISFSWWMFIVIAITMLIKIGMFIGYFASYRVEKSPIIKANMLDSILDSVITAMTLVSFGVSYATDIPVIDAAIGIVLGLLIVISIIKNLKTTIQRIMGTNDIEKEVRKKLEDAGLKIKAMQIFAYGKRIECVLELEEGNVTMEQKDSLEKECIFLSEVKYKEN